MATAERVRGVRLRGSGAAPGGGRAPSGGPLWNRRVARMVLRSGWEVAEVSEARPDRADLLMGLVSATDVGVGSLLPLVSPSLPRPTRVCPSPSGTASLWEVRAWGWGGGAIRASFLGEAPSKLGPKVKWEWAAVEKRMFCMEGLTCTKAWRWVEGSFGPLLHTSGHLFVWGGGGRESRPRAGRKVTSRDINMAQPEGSSLPDCTYSKHHLSSPPLSHSAPCWGCPHLPLFPRLPGFQPRQPPGWIGHPGSRLRTFAPAVAPA